MTEYDECVHSHPVVYGSWSHDGSKILSFCVEGDEYYIWNFFDDSMNRRKKAKCKSFPVSCSVVAACWVIELSSVAIITSDKRLTIFVSLNKTKSLDCELLTPCCRTRLVTFGTSSVTFDLMKFFRLWLSKRCCSM